MLSWRNSLRTQLLLWLLLPLVGMMVISIFSSYQLALHFADIAFDAELAENARTLAGQVIQRQGQWVLASPQLSQEALRLPSGDKVYFLITDASGKPIGGNPQLGLPERKASRFPHFTAKILNAEPVRVVTIKVPLNRRDARSFMLIQMAETLNERGILANQVLLNTISHQGILVLLVALLAWVGVRRGLKPLEQLGKEIAHRTPDDLKPLTEAGFPTEVVPLVHHINQLMQRLDGHIEAQKRFIANAAHQLRTPLAGMQTQLEVSMRQTDPAAHQHALNQVQFSLDRTIHLAQQLLSLAKAEPGNLPFQSVDLAALAQDVVESLVPYALERQIEIEFDGPDNAVIVDGQAFNLREMLSNLVDNALLYTPAGGRVTVTLRQNPAVRLSVEDTGSGIPLSLRQKVFERFYRLNPNEGKGSGLGLSIVQEIAKAHQATVSITDGRDGIGTCFTVSF